MLLWILRQKILAISFLKHIQKKRTMIKKSFFYECRSGWLLGKLLTYHIQEAIKHLAVLYNDVRKKIFSKWVLDGCWLNIFYLSLSQSLISIYIAYSKASISFSMAIREVFALIPGHKPLRVRQPVLLYFSVTSTVPSEPVHFWYVAVPSSKFLCSESVWQNLYHWRHLASVLT